MYLRREYSTSYLQESNSITIFWKKIDAGENHLDESTARIHNRELMEWNCNTASWNLKKSSRHRI